METNEDTHKTIDVLANDRDANGDPLQLLSFTAPGHGSVTLDGTSLIYTPNANWNGVDNFNYTIGDGQGNTATGTVVVTVLHINDVPTVSAGSVTTGEDAAVSFAVSGNDGDPMTWETQTLTFTVDSPPTNGTLSLNAATGAAVYTPTANYNGPDSFTVKVTDDATCGGGAMTSRWRSQLPLRPSTIRPRWRD